LLKLVMKFGGTSLANTARIRNAARIVQRFSDNHQIVVVASALGDATDRLLEIGDLAVRGESREMDIALSRLCNFHSKVAGSIAGQSDKGKLRREIDQLNSELQKTVDGIRHLREMTPRTRDYLLSFGERFATRILATALRSLGLKARPFTGGEAGVTTDDNFGEAKPLIEMTYHELRQRLEPRIAKKEIPVVTGFIALSSEGDVTTLGRGGSDYTASLIGAALGFDEIWIWTDVDGLMTADPRIVKDAQLLSQVSFGEALELSYFGAKMMHPLALQPAAKSKIPARIRNSQKPTGQGTLISAKESDNHGRVVKAVSIIRDVGIVTVVGAGMIGAPGVAAKVFQTLGSNNINVIMISQGSSEATISTVVAKKDVDRAVRALQLALLGQGQVEKISYEKDDCIVAVVGSGMKGTPGVAARVFSSVAAKKVNVRMVAQGSSEYNVSFVVSEKDGPEAVKAIHEEFRLGPDDQ
jgi:aspartate kinase